MKYTIDELKHKVYEKPYAVYNVFKEFFGEEYVDIQFSESPQGLEFNEKYLIPTTVVNEEQLADTDLTEDELAEAVEFGKLYKPFILVYWPTVKITNEYDRSIVIQDLYAKVPMTINGTIPYEDRGFHLNRATYSKDQWLSDYMHSHIQSIPKYNLREFQHPCLGTGPINDTINTLRVNGDEAMWMLFCEELSRYVTVESIQGVPYNHLESVGIAYPISEYGGYNYYINQYSVNNIRNILYPGVLNDFMKYYLVNGHLVIDYKRGVYAPGMSYFDYILDVSNCFIDFFNNELGRFRINLSQLYNRSILIKGCIQNRKFCHTADRRNNRDDISSYIGRTVCKFKGREITLNIIDNGESEMQESILLCHSIAIIVLNKIINVINYRYNGNNSESSEEQSSTTYQRVFYI